MNLVKTNLGYNAIKHQAYPNISETRTLAQESSAIGDYEDSMDAPGSSYLWVGENFHLDREQVEQLVKAMQNWLQHKRLTL